LRFRFGKAGEFVAHRLFFYRYSMMPYCQRVTHRICLSVTLALAGAGGERLARVMGETAGGGGATVGNPAVGGVDTAQIAALSITFEVI
jgi:hypothetical protein